MSPKGLNNLYLVRDAVEADIPALAAIKGEGSEAAHRDRLRDAREGCLRYLVISTAGYRQLYLNVDPLDNPRAHALYRRLGYRQEQAEPYRSRWEFTDSAGQVHNDEEWTVDMVKAL